MVRIKDGTENVDFTIDEVVPTDFNGTLNAGTEMVLTFISIDGNDASDVAQNGNYLRFNNASGLSEGVKIKFSIKPTGDCTIWKYRVLLNGNGFLIFYGVIIRR